MKARFRVARVTIAAIMAGMAVVAAMPAAGARAQGPNPYPFGKSAYWAWQNRPDLPTNLGEPKDWAAELSGLGWPVGIYPRPGSVAVFQPGVMGADPATGHVAVVKQVFDNGSYSATEMGDADCVAGAACGRVVQRDYPASTGATFVYYLKDTRTTWGFGGGAAGWAASGMTAGEAQGSGWRYDLTTDSPLLLSPDLEVPLDGYDAIEVRLASGQATGAATMRVDFATSAEPELIASRAGSAGLVSDGATHTYIIYFGSHSGWAGQLTKLAIEINGGGHGALRVERVRLIEMERDALPALTAIVAAH